MSAAEVLPTGVADKVRPCAAETSPPLQPSQKPANHEQVAPSYEDFKEGAFPSPGDPHNQPQHNNCPQSLEQIDHHPERQNIGQVETQIPERFKKEKVPVGCEKIAGKMERHTQKRRQSCLSAPCQRCHQTCHNEKRQEIMEEVVMICSESVGAEDD